MPAQTPQLDPNSYRPIGGAQASASISSLPDNAAGPSVASTQQSGPASPTIGSSSSQFKPGPATIPNSEDQFTGSPQGVQLDPNSFQPTDQSQSGSQQATNTGANDPDPGLLSRAGETSGISGAMDMASQLGSQMKQDVEKPIDVLTSAIQMSTDGDWKGALAAASVLINSPESFGIDANNPIFKAAEQLVMHPVNAIKEQYSEARKAGQNPLRAGISTAAHVLSQAPTDSDVQAANASIDKELSQGNTAGAIGAGINGALNNSTVRSIPLLGDQLAQVGSLEGEDLHNHNYRAAVGDILGPLLSFGLGKVLGGSAGELSEDRVTGAPTTGVAGPPNPNAPPSLLQRAGANVDSAIEGAKPTTTTIAGIKVPQASTSPMARRISSMASVNAAKEFVNSKVMPAARAALQSNFAKTASTSVDQLRSIRGDDPVALSPPKTPLYNLDKTYNFMKDEAAVTYQKLDDAADHDIAEWKDQAAEAKEQDAAATAERDAQTQANPNAAALGTKPKPITTAQDALPPEPKRFTELQDQLRRADQTIRSTNPAIQQVDREAALKNRPVYQREMDNFIANHEHSVAPGELNAADRVRAQAERYGWLADKIRTATKGLGAGADAGATGKDVKISDATLDNIPSQFDNQFGAGDFDKLLGKAGRENYNAVIKALQVPETGGRLLDWLRKTPAHVGEALVSLPAGALVDNLLFNNQFGRTALNAYGMAKAGATYAGNAAKNAVGAGVTGAAIAKPATMQQDPAVNAPSTMQQVQGALSRNPKKGKPLTALTDGPASSPTDNTVATADKTISQLPPEIQNATSTVPVQVTKGQPMGDPNGRSSTAQVASNVDQGAGNNTIEINNPDAAKDPATMAHELTHVWQNNLPPSVQAKIPDDANDMSAFSTADADKLRKQGKTMVDLPREKQASIVQAYVKDPKGNANLKPWIQDMQKTPLSSTMPTAPDAKGLNMTPRAPGRPDISVAGAYPKSK